MIFNPKQDETCRVQSKHRTQRDVMCDDLSGSVMMVYDYTSLYSSLTLTELSVIYNITSCVDPL